MRDHAWITEMDAPMWHFRCQYCHEDVSKEDVYYQRGHFCSFWKESLISEFPYFESLKQESYGS